MNIAYRTKGGAPVNGKEVIFLHAMQEDAALRDHVTNLILQDADAHRFVVIYVTDVDFPVDFDSPELARTNLYMPLITTAYLQQCPNDFDWESLQSERGIKVLPIVESANLMTRYDQRFSNRHAITLSMQDPAFEIARQLGRMLVDSQLIDNIVHDAFTRSLFISYRKKDRAEIDKIMRSVRGTRWGAATSFWYDDFLVPGTDFEEGIDEAMRTSDAMVLAVTPNLPLPNDEGKPNYVCSNEYPDARAMGKETIAVEAQQTTRSSLAEAFGEDFPAAVPIDDGPAMEQAFGKLGPEEREVDPHVTYLRGMAFLNGIRVERDSERGLDLLDQSSRENVPEAAWQLAYLYSQGIAVPMDHNKEETYAQRTYEIVKAWPDGEEKLEWMHRVLTTSDDDPLGISSSLDEADEYYRDYLSVLERHKEGLSKSDELWKWIHLWQAEAHAVLGSIEGRSASDIQKRGEGYFSEHLNTALQLLKEAKGCGSEHARVAAMVRSLASSLNRHQGELGDAQRNARLAYQYQKDVVSADPSYRARWQLTTYQANFLGCRVLHFVNTRSDGFDPETMTWDTQREAAVRRLELEGLSEAAEELTDALESLYAEKKNASLAYEILETHWNAMRLGADIQTRQLRKSRALDRGSQLREDYPSEGQLQAIYREIEGFDVSTSLADISGGETPPPPSVMRGLFAYILLCALLGAAAEHLIGGIVVLVETIWLIVGGVQVIVADKSPWRLLAGVAFGVAVMYGFAHVVAPMLGLSGFVIAIVCGVIALLSVIL